MKVSMRALGSAVAAILLAGAGLLTFATPAAAASLVQVTNFGSNPTNLLMHLYVPDSVDPQPGVLVASHYCTGTGQAFYSGTEFASLADQFGFIVIYPTANRSGNCFDVSSPQTLQHNGGSDSLAIVSMVNYVLQNHGGDPDRVYATGLSSGAMMTNVLLGAYPDVFSGGAAFAGVPFACFATTDGSMWNSACANGQINRTPQQWGDLVRGAFPGYNGPWPRMQVWHGTNDDTLQYPNFGEELDQWTNVHGVSRTPSFTDSPQFSWTRTRYGGTGTMPPVEGISVQGGSHNVLSNGMALRAVQFLGLDQDGQPPPSSPPPPISPPPSSPPPSSPPPPPPSSEPPPPSSEPPPPPGSGCQVANATNAWNNGLVTNLTVTNTGSSTINGWSLQFTLPGGQNIISGWNATYQPSSGSITATNMPYNPTISPNGSVTIGFQATHTGNAGTPSSYTLNGAPCTVA
jgi:acetylxylan esterase